MCYDVVKTKKILFVVGIGLFSIIIGSLFFNSSSLESSCNAEIVFTLGPNHNLDLQGIVNQVKNDFSNELFLPDMTITGSYISGQENNVIYIFIVEGEYYQNSTTINSIRNTLESIPEVSRVSDESEVRIYCPPK